MLHTIEWDTLILPEEPLKKKLIRNWFRLYFFAFIAAPAWYIIKIIIARQISVEDIWVLYSILWIIWIVSTYNDLGLTESLQYYLPHYLIDKKYNEAKTIIVFTRFMQFVSWIIVWWVLYFFAPYLSETYFSSPAALPILRFFCIYFLINNLFQVLQSIFIAIQNVKRSQWIEAIRVWSVVIFTLIASIWSNLSLFTFTYAWFWWLIIWIICALIWMKRHFWKIFSKSKIILEKKTLTKQWTYWFWVMLWLWAWMLLWQINQLLAQYRLGSKIAWYWTYYLSFYSAIHIFTSPIINYLFPLLNELYKKWHHEKIKLLHKMLFIWVIIFSIIASLAAYFFSEKAAIILFGQNFAYVWTMFSYFSPFIFTLPLIWILYQDIASRGFVKERFYSIVLWLLINVLASRWFIKTHQAIWLVYWQACWNIILVILGLYHYKKRRT